MMTLQMKGGYDSDDESNISRLVGGRVQEDSLMGASSQIVCFQSYGCYVD